MNPSSYLGQSLEIRENQTKQQILEGTRISRVISHKVWFLGRISESSTEDPSFFDDPRARSKPQGRQGRSRKSRNSNGRRLSSSLCTNDAAVANLTARDFGEISARVKSGRTFTDGRRKTRRQNARLPHRPSILSDSRRKAVVRSSLPSALGAHIKRNA